MKAFSALGIVSALLLSSQTASAEEVFAVSPTGQPEALFANEPEEVLASLSELCRVNEGNVVEREKFSITCEFEINGDDPLTGVLNMVTLSESPRAYFRFDLNTVDGGTMATASGWAGTVSLGRESRVAYEDARFQNNVTNFMLNAGGQYTPGTTFPNHALLGLRLEPVEQPRRGYVVRELVPGGLGDQAQLALEDVITRIAGERVREPQDLLPALEEAAEERSFTVEFYRGSERRSVTFETVFRDPIPGAPLGNLSPRVSEGEPQSIELDEPGTTSVTDSIAELERLADLRDRGVLSEAEFTQMKARILANDPPAEGATATSPAWVLVNSNGGGWDQYVDRRSIRMMPNGYKLAWVRQDFGRPNRHGDTSKSNLTEFDCATGRFRHLEQVYYQEEEVTTQDDRASKWMTASRIGIGSERELAYVCEGRLAE